MINVIVSGIVTGVLYAVAGLGLVAVYRTSKVLNFAMGGMGATAAYVASDLLDAGVGYVWVFAIAIALGALLGLLVEVGVARPLRRRPPLTIAIGTLGALLILQGILVARYGFSPTSLREPLAGGGTLRIGSFAISAGQLLILAFGVVLTAILLAVVGRTRLGLAMRATSSGPQTAALLGVNVSRTRLSAWMIGGAYGALAALLVTPLTYLAPSSFTTFLLTAFAAVVLGGFTSIPGVVIGAIAFGVAINVLETYLSARLIDVYTFIGIALVLVLRPHGLFGQREHEVPEPALRGGGRAVGLGRRTEASPLVSRRWPGWVAVLVLLALAPFVLVPPSLYLLATALASFIGVMGLNVLVGYTGQVSLGHSAFLAIGAFAAAIAVDRGVPVLLTLIVAPVVGAVAGLIIGLPAGRLSGIYLALLTLIFSFAIPELIQEGGDLTGGANGLPLTLPTGLSDPAPQYWFVLAVATVATAATLVAAASRLGRGWRAVRDSEEGARALGLNPAAIKLGAFAWSSAFAALSGAVSGLLVGFVGPGTYGVFLSIYALLAVVLGGTGSIFGSLLGALFITLVPNYIGGTGVPQDLVFGAAMLAVLLLAPAGVVGLLERLGGNLRHRRRTVASPAADAPQAAAAPARANGGAPAQPPLLELRGVSVGYGMVEVLHDVSLSVRPGEMVALIGANGAGKSTLLRTVSGLLVPSRGDLLWRGEPLPRGTAAVPHRVARLGIAHVPEGRAIFPDLTVSENLAMGTFSIDGNGRRPILDREQVFERFPRLGERAGQRAGTLSGGEQQMLAISRALLGAPELLMLDEPSLGLAPVVAERVFEQLREIAGSGVAILLVEQNAEAALRLADRAYVVNRGRIVLAGTGDELRSDERVRESYLSVGAA